MEFKAEQIAAFIGGKVEGNPDATVHTFAKIEEGTNGASLSCPTRNTLISFTTPTRQ